MARNRNEKRRLKRTLAADVLISVTLTPFETGREIWGVVVDYSDNGFQITVPVEITAGTLLKVIITRQSADGSWELEHLFGRVVWCLPDAILEETYNLGIELRDLRLLQPTAGEGPR